MQHLHVIHTTDQKGFTLVEVMAALAVVAVGIAATVTVVSSIALNMSRLEDKAMAQWLGSNRLAEIRLKQHESEQSSGSSSNTITMAAREWYVFDVLKKTDVKGVYEATITVCVDSLKSNCPFEQSGFFSALSARNSR